MNGPNDGKEPEGEGPEEHNDDWREQAEAQAQWEEDQARAEADAENFHSRYDE